MKVKLVYKTKDNKFYGTTNTITIKKAKELTKKLLIENTTIIEIYLKVWNGWHWKRCKTLYKK